MFAVLGLIMARIDGLWVCAGFVLVMPVCFRCDLELVCLLLWMLLMQQLGCGCRCFCFRVVSVCARFCVIYLFGLVF